MFYYQKYRYDDIGSDTTSGTIKYRIKTLENIGTLVDGKRVANSIAGNGGYASVANITIGTGVWIISGGSWAMSVPGFYTIVGDNQQIASIAWTNNMNSYIQNCCGITANKNYSRTYDLIFTNWSSNTVASNTTDTPAGCKLIAVKIR